MRSYGPMCHNDWAAWAGVTLQHHRYIDLNPNPTSRSRPSSSHSLCQTEPNQPVNAPQFILTSQDRSHSKAPAVIWPLLTLPLAVAAVEEAGYGLGCPPVHLYSAVVEDRGGGSCRRSPFWRDAGVCCHARGVCAQNRRARGWGSR